MMGIVSAIIILAFSTKIQGIIHSMMNTTGALSSDSIRSGQIEGLIKTLKKPQTLLFGSGCGSPFL